MEFNPQPYRAINKIAILLLVAVTVFSCSTIKQNEYTIVNSVLNNENDNSQFTLHYKGSFSFIDKYLQQYEDGFKTSSKSIEANFYFEKGYDWILSKEDIQEMRKMFSEQRNIFWNKEKFDNKNIMLSTPATSINNKAQTKKYVSISRALFNKKRNKAIIDYFEEQNGLKYYCAIFVKEDGKWKYVGKIYSDFISTM